jgi:hypothetical protein
MAVVGALQSNGDVDRGVEPLTRTLPIDIFSCSPFATIFSLIFKFILCNTFSYLGVNLMHAIKSKCLFGFGSI